MNDDQAEEMRAIRAEQEALRAQAERLEQRLRQFEKNESAARPVAPAAPPPPPLPATPAPVGTSVDTVLPPSAQPASPLGSIAEERVAGFLTERPPVPPAAVQPITRRDSLEMRLGSGWLVYIGVAVLLASLVFLGDYLYRNVIPHAGPLPKVGLLYLGAGLLAGVGLWIERTRRGRDDLDVRNYARVLLGGGLAAAYYVTYAAHHFPNLRIIGSPLLDSVLLVGWTVVMVWMADRRGSETMAALAVLLAFGTSAVSEVAGFTLVASIPLAVGAAFLLRRHRWRVFPFTSLLAAFGGYAFWRTLHLHDAGIGLTPGQPAHAVGGFWIEGGFLSIYWVLFTGMVFTAAQQAMPVGRRAVFAGLNNTLFFLLVTWLCLEDYPGSFWKWSLAFGIALLLVSEVCRQLPLWHDHHVENAYLLEGVLFVTLGCIAYFSGWQLSLLLAVESVVLVAAAQQRENLWLLAGAALVAAMASILALFELGLPHGGNFRVVGPAVGALLAVNVWMIERSPTFSVSGGASAIFEVFALALTVAWGEQYFPYAANFSLFALLGAALFILGVETRRDRFLLWSYVLTGAGLVTFFLFYGMGTHRLPIQLLGIACLIGERQYTRQRMLSFWAARFFPPRTQILLMSAAVITGWVTWSAMVNGRTTGGLIAPESWPMYAAMVFAAGLALRERVYRRWALVVLVATLGHVIVIDIWHLDSLQRFYSLLCLGLVLLGIGFFYTRFQEQLHDLF